jgi:hypothetical protein
MIISFYDNKYRYNIPNNNNSGEEYMESNLENIKNIFSKMQEDGRDISQALKWEYFFVSQEEERLKQIYKELKDHKYLLESIHQTDDKRWVLQASKTEILAPEKLHKRNISFNELAEHYKSIYDRWNVGKD